MEAQRFVKTVLNLVTSVALIDVGVFAVVGLVCLAVGGCTLQQYGEFLTWAGVAIVLGACLMGVGGLSSRGEDIAAYSLTGAGKMSDHLRRSALDRVSNIGCLLLLLASGALPLVVGILLQSIS